MKYLLQTLLRPTLAGSVCLAFSLAAASAATHTVNFRGFVFEPSQLTIDVGDTVTFVNKGGSHTVTGTGAEPYCGNNFVPTSCSVTFNTPGTFPYICRPHQAIGMVGSITVRGVAAKPNLIPFRLNGWSDRLVVTRAQGNRISDSGFFDDEDIFVHWAIANISTATGIPGRFFTELLIDGQPKFSWSHDGLAADTFSSVTDFNIGKLPEGDHVLRLVTDHTRVVDESEESDNVYEVNVRVNPRNVREHTVLVTNFDFIPKTLTVDVGDSVTFSRVSGTHTVTGNGAEPFCGNGAMPPSCRVTFNTPGTYNYRCLFHPSMTGSITVVGTGGDKPNVAPFHINGWSDRIVVSRAPGNNTSDPDFFEDQDIFVDWAIANVSLTTGIPGTFFTELLIDGTSVGSWSHNGLPADMFNSVVDFNAGKLPAGQHKFRLVTDHTGVVDESDETDNSYEVNVSVVRRTTGVVHAVAMRDFEFSPQVLTVKTGDTVEIRNEGGFHTVTGTGADPYCGDGQVQSVCTVKFNQTGIYPYRCLFHSSDGPDPTGMVGVVRVVDSITAVAASNVTGPYSPVGEAVVDYKQHTITLPKPGSAMFWRLVSDVALRIKSVEPRAASILIHFE